MGSPAPQVPVWDPLVRIGHWTLAACVAAAWFTRSGGHEWHERFGYAALAVVVLRVAWGFAGPRNARFSAFVHPPASTLGYARLVLAAREPRHAGHNPLGGWMIVALLVMVTAVSLSGWLYTTDAYWGVKWVAELHEALTDVLLGLIALHLAGVALASYRHRENLIAAMIHGRKRQ
jgi:cytochrome b